MSSRPLESDADDRNVVAAEALISEAFERFSVDRIGISFSGAEDVVLIDIAHRIRSDVHVFSLDTGRLHPETYRFIERVREHYGVTIELVAPDADDVADLVRRKGLFSFYRDGHQECCAIRKIKPLRRHLGRLDAWITGQRRDQSVTRGDVPLEQDDVAFSTIDHRIVKFNPLANWTSADVWAYIRSNNVPYNPLHDAGFISIGCEPCTRPVGPHERERSGRWWWEDAAGKECGLHSQNLRPVKIVG
jgi:phosphoadenosine phosphosulfate reductase